MATRTDRCTQHCHLLLNTPAEKTSCFDPAACRNGEWEMQADQQMVEARFDLFVLLKAIQPEFISDRRAADAISL